MTQEPLEHVEHSPENHFDIYVLKELPGYRGELTLLMMAGFDPSYLPSWAIFVFLGWIIPLAGQIGMNPILAVTLIAPLIPSAIDLGAQPTTLVVAITAGWAFDACERDYR